MPLVVAPVGKDVRVVKILADEKTKKHLENLGITIDSVIRVISLMLKALNPMACLSFFRRSSTVPTGQR